MNTTKTEKKRIKPIALFDMDGTLCNYEKGLFEQLEKLRSPNEPIFHPPIPYDAPKYIKARADLIRSSSLWWVNLPKFQLGWDVLKIARKLEYRVMILTQGPKRNAESWKGKKEWIDRYLGQETEITITRDKGLIYGRVLVDDFSDYIEGWLSWRDRGLVIMPANKSNKKFKHPQVIRYDSTNLAQVRRAMVVAKNRKDREYVDFSKIY